MATNQTSKGQTIEVTLGGTVAAGAVWVGRGMIGIYLTGGVSGDVVSVAITGRWTVPKVTGAVFAQGEKLLWDVSAGQVDDDAATPASGDIMGACVAATAGANGETTADVILTPGNTTRTP